MIHKTFTPAQLSEELGVSIDAIRKRFNAISPEKQFNQNHELNGTLVPLLEHYAKRNPKAQEILSSIQDKSVSVPKPRPQQAARPKVSTRNLGKPDTRKWVNTENWELDIINFLDMGLVVIGLYLLYNIPGVVLAVMVCLFLYKAQGIAKNPKLKTANRNALSVVLGVCVASFFLHVITFWNTFPVEWETVNPGRKNLEVWQLWTNAAKIAGAVIPALFVSILSYKSVETTSKVAKEEKK